jgi:hypothetical protein
MIELVVVGERFYKESQTWMSPIYREKPKGVFYRYDWGFMCLDMMAGKELHIRSATKKEIAFFEEKLNEHLIKMGHQKGLRAQVVAQQDFFDFVLPEIGKPLVMSD